MTISNTGTADLVVSNIIASNPYTYNLTLPLTLAPNANRAVEITFTPTAVQPQNGSLTLICNDTPTPLEVALTGTGIAPEISLSELNLSFDPVEVGKTSTTTLVISNSEKTSLLIETLSIDSDLFIISPSAPFTIGPETSQDMTVSFTPAISGPVQATLTISSDDPINPVLSLALSALGFDVPDIDAPSLISFGEVTEGSSTRQVRIANIGTGPLQIAQIRLEPEDTPFALDTDQRTDITLAPGSAPYTFNVTYTPPNRAEHTGTLIITSNDPDQPQIAIPLNGGVNVPVAELSAPTLSFVPILIGASTSLPLQLRNTGTAPLVVTDLALESSVFTVDQEVPFTLAAGDNALLNLTFAPTEATEYAAGLTLHFEEIEAKEIALVGIGQTPIADIEVTPPEISFDVVGAGTSNPATVAIRNIGTGPLQIAQVRLEPEDTPFALDTDQRTDITLAPGSAPYTFNITYTPPPILAEHTGTLIITSNDPDEPQIAIPLNGRKNLPAAEFFSTSLAFGAVILGESISLPLQLRNTGTAPLIVTDLELEEQQGFTVDQEVPFTLAAGDNALLNLTFAPTEATEYAAGLTLHFEEIEAKEIALVGIGQTPIADIEVTPPEISFGEVTEGSSTRQVRIANIGTGPLQIAQVRLEPEDTPFALDTDQRTDITLAPGSAPYTFNVTYTPFPNLTEHTGTLIITSNDPDQPQIAIPLNGGVNVPVAELSPALLSFETVILGESATLPFQLRNTGTAPLVVTDLALESSVFTVDQEVPFTLAAGDNALLNLTFAPTEATEYAAGLTLHFEEIEAKEIALVGIGQTPIADIEVTPPEISFGEVTEGSSTRQVRIANIGTGPLQIAQVRLEPEDTPFALDTDQRTDITLAPGSAPYTFNVTYTPLILAEHTGTLIITSNDLDQPQIAIPLNGGVNVPVAELSPALLSFETVILGESATLPFQLHNAGTASLVVTALELVGQQGFTVDQEVPFTLAPGDNAFLDFTFTPIALIDYAAILTLHFEEVAPIEAILTGLGLAPPANPSAVPILRPQGEDPLDPRDPVVLTWIPAVGASSYEIELSTTDDFSGDTSIEDVRQTRYMPDNLASGITYYWRVRAFNAQGDPGQWSEADAFLIETESELSGVQIPSSITNLSFANSALSDKWTNTPSFELQWENPADTPEGYQVYFKFGDKPTSATDFSGRVSGSSSLSINPPGQGAQEVYIWLANVNGDADHTSAQSLTVRYDRQPPVPPSSLVSSAQTWSNATQVNFNWAAAVDAHAGIETYVFYLNGVEEERTAATQLTYRLPAEFADGRYNWAIEAIDKAGNTSARREGIIQVDRTPPENPSTAQAFAADGQALAPQAWYNQLQPHFTWSDAQDATAGVAGYAAVLTPDPEATADTSTLLQAAAYTAAPLPDADGVYYLRLRTRDQAGNWSATKTLFTYQVDRTPPENPSTAQAFAADGQALAPQAWYNQLQPHFTWNDAQDATAGVAGYAAVLTPDPEATADTSTLLPAAAYTAAPLPDTDGVYYLRLRTRDQAGNWSATKTLFTYQVDRTPPNLVLPPPAVQPPNTDLLLNLQVTEAHGAPTVELYYRQSGATDFSASQPLEVGADGTIAATIDGSVLGSFGIEYYVVATDQAGNIGSAPKDGAQRPVSIPLLFTSINAANPFPDKQWRMFSLPAQTETNSALEVLTALGGYNPQQWRLFQYVEGRYREFDPARRATGVLLPGLASWLHTLKPFTLTTEGPATTMPTSPPVRILLPANGWTDISTPYLFALRWSDIMAANGNPEGLKGPYTYTGQDWTDPAQTEVLEPWEGYAVKNLTSAPITLIMPPKAANPQAKPAVDPADGALPWRLQLQVHDNQTADRHNYLGVRPDARRAWDQWDQPEPPWAPGAQVRLYFPRPDWPRYPELYAADYRPTATEGIWDFVIESRQQAVVAQLVFVHHGQLAADQAIRLLDVQGGVALDLSQVQHYPVTLGGNGARRTFQIVVGEQAFVEEQAAAYNSRPLDYQLAQNWPNPFNGGTTIAFQVPQQGHLQLKVYDLLGQEVAVLVDEIRDPGYFTTVWDGRDQQGRALASGVYFVALQAKQQQWIRKMLLVR